MHKATTCISDLQLELNPSRNLTASWRLRLQRWYRNWRTRQQLAQLDDRLLKDIGLSRGDAAEELRKPFWRD